MNLVQLVHNLKHHDFVNAYVFGMNWCGTPNVEIFEGPNDYAELSFILSNDYQMYLLREEGIVKVFKIDKNKEFKEKLETKMRIIYDMAKNSFETSATGEKDYIYWIYQFGGMWKIYMDYMSNRQDDFDEIEMLEMYKWCSDSLYLVGLAW